MLCCTSWLGVHAQDTPDEQRQTDVQQTVRYFLYDAVRNIDERHHDQAYMQLMYCLRIDPRNATAHYLLAQVYETFQDKKEYVRQLKLAVECDPANWTYRSEYIQSIDDDDEIESRLLQEVKQNKDNAEAWQYLLFCYAGSERYRQAYQAVSQIERIKGPGRNTAWYKAKIHLCQHHLKQALKETERIQRLRPNDPICQKMKGDVYIETGQYAQAVSELKNVADRYPDNVYAIQSLMQAYVALGDTTRIRQCALQAVNNNRIDIDDKMSILTSLSEQDDEWYKRVEITDLINQMVEQYPQEERLHNVRLYILEQAQDTAAAEAERSTILELNPLNAYARMGLIQTQVSRGNYKDAAAMCEEAAALDPDDFNWLLTAAQCYWEMKDYPVTILTADRAIGQIGGEPYSDHQERFAKAHLLQMKGMASFETGQDSVGYACYDELLSMDPNNALVLNNYAYQLAVDSIDLPRAEQMISAAVRMAPNNPVYLDTYAWVFYRRGNLTLARFYIERAMSNMDSGQLQDPEIWEHYAAIQSASGREEEARKAAEKAGSLRKQKEKEDVKPE